MKKRLSDLECLVAYHTARAAMEKAQVIAGDRYLPYAQAILEERDLHVSTTTGRLHYVPEDCPDDWVEVWCEVWRTPMEDSAELAACLGGIIWRVPLAGLTPEQAGKWARSVWAEQRAVEALKQVQEIVSRHLPGWTLTGPDCLEAYCAADVAVTKSLTDGPSGQG